MPAPPRGKDKNAGDKDKIPITSPQQLHDELKAFKTALSVVETEHTWQALDRALQRYTAVTRGGGCKYEEEYVQGLKDRELAKAIIGCISTERTTLSASALVFLSAATRLGHAFAPLVSLYLPHILRLLSRTNKLYISRATACLISIIRNTRLTSVIPYLREGMDEKPASHRKGCIAGLLCALGGEEGFEMTEGILVDKEVLQRRYLDDVEKCIRIGARDKDIEVRRLAKKAWLIYRREFSERVNSFAAPLTPTIRKYLELPPPGQAISSYASSSTHTVQPVRAQKAVQPIQHVTRHPPPPRAPSPVKSSTARPPSRNDLGASTSSAVLGRSGGYTTATAPPAASASTASEFRPPSRQALPPNPLARSFSATAGMHQRSASHDQSEQPFVRQNVLSRSVTSSVLETASQSFPFERSMHAPPTATLFSEHDRQASASSSTSTTSAANSERSDDSRRAFRPNPPIATTSSERLDAPTRPTMPAQRPPSREQLSSEASRPVVGPRRAGPGRHRERSANDSQKQPFQLKSARVPLPPPVTASSEDQAEEEESLPLKRPASAMSASSIVSMEHQQSHSGRVDNTISGSGTSEEISSDRPSSQPVVSTTPDLPEPTAPPAKEPSTSAQPFIPPTNPLSASCPPSTSTFNPQPPLPSVDIASLAAQLPKQNSSKTGRPAFRPARPNVPPNNSSQAFGQVRRVPSSSALSSRPPAQARSVSSSMVSGKAPTSLKDTLAQDRSQAAPAKKPVAISQSNHAAPPAKRQALSSSTSSSSFGKQAVPVKASQSAAATSTTIPSIPKTKAPAFKPTPSTAPKPRTASQGSIFSRLAAPTASSAARASAAPKARVAASSLATSQSTKEEKAKEVFKKPGLPSSKSDKKLAAESTVPSSNGNQASQQPQMTATAPAAVESESPTAHIPKLDETNNALSDGQQQPTDNAVPDTKHIMDPEIETEHHEPVHTGCPLSEATATPLPQSPVSPGQQEEEAEQHVKTGSNPAEQDILDEPTAAEHKAPADGNEAAASAVSGVADVVQALSPYEVDMSEEQSEAPVNPCFPQDDPTIQAVSISLEASEVVTEQLQSAETEVNPGEEMEDPSIEAEATVEPDGPEGVEEHHIANHRVEEHDVNLQLVDEDGQATATEPSSDITSLSDAPDAEALVQSLPVDGNGEDGDPLEAVIKPSGEAAKDEESQNEGTTIHTAPSTTDHGAPASPGAKPVVVQQSPARPTEQVTSPSAVALSEPPSAIFPTTTSPAVPDPASSSILFSPTKDGVNALMLEDEPTQHDIDDTIIEHAANVLNGEPDAPPRESEEEEEEDDVALLISRELSDDSLEELASRFESSRLYGLEQDDEEDVENTPVRPRLISHFPDEEEEEEEQDDDTQTINFTAKGNNDILGGLSKTPSAMRSKQVMLEENNVLRTL